MKRQIYVNSIVVLAAALSTARAIGYTAQNSNGSGEKSQSKTSGNPATTLAAPRTLHAANGREDAKAFARQGRYWASSIRRKTSRALQFFLSVSVCPSLYSRCSGLEGKRDWRLYRLAVFAGCR